MSGQQSGWPNLVSEGARKPFDFYARLRRQGSPLWDPDLQAWLITSFDQCVEVGRDNASFGSIYAGEDELLTAIKGGRAAITISQGDEHARLRRFHLRLLNEHAKRSYVDIHVKPIVRFVIDQLQGKTSAELCQDVFAQVAPRVICSLMGMPFDDDQAMTKILVLNEPIVAFIGSSYNPDLAQAALAASLELNDLLRPHVRANRLNPSDNFIGRVWRDAPAYYGDLTEEDAIAICRDLFLTGSDTTIHASANAMHILLTYPEIMARLQRDKSTLNAVIEESLRLFASVQIRHRRATRACRIGEKEIGLGDMVVLVHASANRDEQKYDAPDDIVLDRAIPHDHLTFGRGPRSCVGAALARAEIEITLASLIDRFPRIEADALKERPSFDGFFTRSHRPLHVRLNAPAEASQAGQ